MNYTNDKIRWGFCFMFVLLAFHSYSQTSNNCEEYAKRAIEQHKSNVEKNCGYTGNRWSSDFEGHYNWCQIVTIHLALFEENERAKALESCNKKDAPVDQVVYNPNDIQSYEQTHHTKNLKDISNLRYSKELKWEFNTNYPGMDYKSIELPEANCRLCEIECLNDPDCKAFTYVKPGIQGEKARCWLKSTIPAKHKDECCISAYKLSKPEIMSIWLDRNDMTIHVKNITRGKDETKIIYSNPEQQVILDNRSYTYNELQINSLIDNKINCIVPNDLFGKTIDIQVFVEGIGYSVPFNIIIPNTPVSIDEKAVITYSQPQFANEIDKLKLEENTEVNIPAGKEVFLKNVGGKKMRYLLVDRNIEISSNGQWDTTLVDFWGSSSIFVKIDFYTPKPKGFRLEFIERNSNATIPPIVRLTGKDATENSGNISTFIPVPPDRKRNSDDVIVKIYNSDNEEMFVNASIGFISSK